ncbi:MULTISPECIES: hypothetical protein [Amycolatopsis]|uniref:Secreted protein n=1 Tax=Amycolatopsis thermoflava TaxID=84480 RepID=A0A3N2GVM1_9PSEU|nr:hypothetical protein [Amycolatopsis thermoflava]ROS40731.1 hypothetical protein EDD35_3071 [Amycolatopsis thermoflava]
MRLLNVRTLSAAAAVAAAGVLVPAGTAAAMPDPPGDSWDHTFTAPGVTVYVEEYGDRISVCDSAANGSSAQVNVWADGGWRYKAVASGGSGSCVTHSASEGGAYNLPEGAFIELYYKGVSTGYATRSTYVNDH